MDIKGRDKWRVRRNGFTYPPACDTLSNLKPKTEEKQITEQGHQK
jgi:hypothetical protein